MRSRYVSQAGLELLASSDPPASASPSARTTGVSHHTQPLCFYSRTSLRQNSSDTELKKEGVYSTRSIARLLSQELSSLSEQFLSFLRAHNPKGVYVTAS